MVLRFRMALGLHIPTGVGLTLGTPLQTFSEPLLNPGWARIMGLQYPSAVAWVFLRKYINISRCLGNKPSHQKVAAGDENSEGSHQDFTNLKFNSYHRHLLKALSIDPSYFDFS